MIRMHTPVLILGSTGRLGKALCRRLEMQTGITALPRRMLDATDAAAVDEVLRCVRPVFVINAVAYTAVDRAQTECDDAWRLNAEVPSALAAACARHGAALIHYSSGYVYDGHTSVPYVETDEAKPASVYGASKLAGDEAVLVSPAAALVLRTNWLYGDAGDFVQTMLSRVRTHDTVRVVCDQWGGAHVDRASRCGHGTHRRQRAGQP